MVWDRRVETTERIFLVVMSPAARNPPKTTTLTYRASHSQVHGDTGDDHDKDRTALLFIAQGLA